MFFFCKPKKVTIDCFVSNSQIFNRYKIDKAFKYAPKWWAKLSGSTQYTNKNNIAITMPTLKKCNGIIDLYDKSFILPLWSDLILENVSTDTGINYKYQFADSTSIITSHAKNQYPNSFENYIHGKIISPWRIKDSKGISFRVGPCNWSLLNITNNICILDGILQFKHQTNTHINFLYNYNAEPNILLEAGTPMLHFHPLSDKIVELKHHQLDFIEFEKMFKDETIALKFIGDYRDRQNKNSLPR